MSDDQDHRDVIVTDTDGSMKKSDEGGSGSPCY
jgi:hypothetical protein